MAFANTQAAALDALNDTVSNLDWTQNLPSCQVMSPHAGDIPFEEFDPLSIDYYVASWRSWVTGVVLASVLLLLAVLFLLWLLGGTRCACCCRRRRVWKPVRVRRREDKAIFKGAQAGSSPAQDEIDRIERCCCGVRVAFSTQQWLRHSRTVLLVLLVLGTMAVAIWCLVLNWQTSDHILDTSWSLFHRAEDKIVDISRETRQFLNNATSTLQATDAFLEELQGQTPNLPDVLSGSSLDVGMYWTDAAMDKVSNVSDELSEGMATFVADYNDLSNRIVTAWQFTVLGILLAVTIGALLMGLLGASGVFGRGVAVIAIIMLLATIPLIAAGAVAMSTLWNTASDSCLYFEEFVVDRFVVDIEPPAARYGVILAVKVIADAAERGVGGTVGGLASLTGDVVSEAGPTFATDLLTLAVDQLPPELVDKVAGAAGLGQNVSQRLQASEGGTQPTDILGLVADTTTAALDQFDFAQVLSDLAGSVLDQLRGNDPPDDSKNDGGGGEGGGGSRRRLLAINDAELARLAPHWGARRLLQQSEPGGGGSGEGENGGGLLGGLLSSAGRVVGAVTGGGGDGEQDGPLPSLVDDARDAISGLTGGGGSGGSAAGGNRTGSTPGTGRAPGDADGGAVGEVAGALQQLALALAEDGLQLNESVAQIFEGQSLPEYLKGVGLGKAADVVSDLPPRLQDVLALAMNAEATARAFNATIRGVGEAIQDSGLEMGETFQLLLSLANITTDAGFASELLARVGASTQLARTFLELVNPWGEYLGATLRSGVTLAESIVSVGVLDLYQDVKEFVCCDLTDSLQDLYIAFTLTGVLSATVSILLVARAMLSTLTPERATQREAALAGAAPKQVDLVAPQGPYDGNVSVGKDEVGNGGGGGLMDGNGLLEARPPSDQFIAGASR